MSVCAGEASLASVKERREETREVCVTPRHCSCLCSLQFLQYLDEEDSAGAEAHPTTLHVNHEENEQHSAFAGKY